MATPTNVLAEVLKREWPIKLSVMVVTYNQERYIEQTLNSALMQRTNFPFEIVIGEDCSKDKTREICQRFADQYPDKIRLLLREKNLGMHENHRQTHFECRGQYIAMLEGDDFWTHPDKLQRQVDFLDAHPDCVLSYHNVLIFDEHTNEEAFYCRQNHPEIQQIQDLIQEIFVNTASVVLRNGLFEEFPETGKDLLMGDWSYYIWLASFGKLGYLPDVMACYRQHEKGTWMSASVGERITNVVKMYDDVNKFFNYQYHGIIQILKGRYRHFYEMDGSRRKWKAKAEKAEKRVEDLERSRRILKLRQRDLEQQVRGLETQVTAASSTKSTVTVGEIATPATLKGAGGEAWPKISVITCSYNQVQFLDQCLRSVLDQGYPNLEYIVVDGGSTDGSADLLRRYADRFAWWCSERDDGQSEAINKGFSHATGQLYTFINSDDYLNPGSLHRAAEAFRQGHRWITSDCRIDRGGKLVEETMPARSPKKALNWFMRNPLPQPGTFWAADLHGKGLDTRFPRMFDYEMWMRLHFRHNLMPHIVPGAKLATYRDQLDSFTSRATEKFVRDFFAIHREYADVLTTGERRTLRVLSPMIRLVARSIATHMAARDAGRQGRRLAAAGGAALSILYWPPVILMPRTWAIFGSAIRGGVPDDVTANEPARADTIAPTPAP